MPYKSKQLPAEKTGLIRGLFFALLMTIVITILLTACGKDGLLRQIEKPRVVITSYEGVEDTADIDTTYYFQRRIFWRGESTEGVIRGFAYRVLTADRDSVVHTPKTHIDKEEGWIYHYKPGADQSIPLSGDPRSGDVRTIWTMKPFDVIHFPATTDGDSSMVTSVFEIKCKDHYDQESDLVSRYFNVRSHKPYVDVIFSDRFRPIAAAQQENPDIRNVGLGFEVEFEIVENTPYTTPQNVPNYFKFRVEQREINVNTGEIGDVIRRSPDGDNLWYDTRGQKDVTKIWLAQTDDNPADFGDRDDVHFILKPDQFVGGTATHIGNPVTETVLYMKAVNMAGVYSVERYAQFRIYDNFRPQAIIYTERTNVLGRNHFTTYQDGSLMRPLPEIQVPGEGAHFGTPFFISRKLDDEGNIDGHQLSTLWSDDLRIYLRWGWKGQYEGDDPDRGFINEVHDIATSRDYLANVKAFDLRLGDAPYPYPPMINHPQFQTRFLYTDPDDGTQWLRVPRFYDRDIDTRALLTGIPHGDYTLSVRVVDSQNRMSEVETFQFLIAERVPREQKQGVLIIDNETYPNPVFKSYTKDFYNEVLEGMDVGPVEVINRQELRTNFESLNMHFGRIFLSTADLERYRLVIWHCDNPTEIGPNNANIHHEYEVVNIYLRGGGNMLLSGGSNINAMRRAAESQSFVNPTLHLFFGLTYRSEVVTRSLSNSMVGPAAKQYFIGAKPAAGFTPRFKEVNLDFTHPFLAALGDRVRGLAPITLFSDDSDDYADAYTSVFYRMKVVEPADPDNEDLVEDINKHRDAPVAIRRKSPNNSTYVFGFPLSYIDRDEVIDLLKEVYRDTQTN